jgi:tetratricopeptide (TPR) repeat protein
MRSDCIEAEKGHRMSTRITINCPNCSAALAAPGSSAGKTLLCPKCRAAIPVPELSEADNAGNLKSDNNVVQNHSHGSHELSSPADVSSPRRSSRRRLAIGFSVPLILGLSVVVMFRFQEWRKSEKIETAFQARDFDLVLTLNPGHEEALIERIHLRLQLPDTNVEGAVSDLEQLKKIAPQHSIHNEILPQLTIARSMELASGGRITAALKELDLAASLGGPEQQLNLVKRRLTSLLLKQIEKNLAEKNYSQVISDCDSVRKLSGDNMAAIAFERSALCGLADRAVTDEEMSSIIRRLEELDKGLHLAETTGKLQSLYSRRSRLNHSTGDLAGAIDDYTKQLACDSGDLETLRWGVTLSEATIVALEDDFSKLHLQRALLLIDLLEKNFVNAASVLRVKICLADKMFSTSTTQNRDEALNYAAISLRQAHAMGFIVEIIDGKGDFRRRISAALVERGFDHIKADRIEEGGRDFEEAMKILPEKQDQLLSRLNQLPESLRQQFPASIRGEEADIPADSILDLIPAKAEAFSVIRNMQSFSNKLDEVASCMLVDPPKLLDAACRMSRIKDGLKREGSLGWVHMPVTDDPDNTKGMLFFLPATDFVGMIQDIKTAEPVKSQPLIPVTMNGHRGLAVQKQSHGIFAFERDRDLLSATIQEPEGIQDKLIPFEGWDQDLDAYFVTTRQGIRNDFRSIRIPFADGFFKPLLQQAGDLAIQSEALSDLTRAEVRNQLQQLAVGVAIQSDLGIAARSRIWLSPESDLEKIFSENPGGREAALSQLPDEKFLIAVGGPVSAVQSGWITRLPELLSPVHRSLTIRISRVQAAVLAPEPEFAPEDEDGNPAAQPHSDNPFLQLLNRTVLVVTVDDSQVALTELKAFLVGEGFATETVEQDHIPVLRIVHGFPIGEHEVLDLRIATPNRESLVFAYGGDAQLKRALEPFRNPENLSKSRTTKAAVRMLPQSTSWLVAMDLRVLGEWLRRLRNPIFYSAFLSSILLHEDENSLPLAVGMSWQKSDLDVNVSIPVETLPLAGRIALIFNLVP